MPSTIEHASRGKLGVLIFLVGMASIAVADNLPSYSPQYAGAGSIVALNNADAMVGYQTNASGLQVPLLSLGGDPWTTLPIPAGATSAFPTDLNDAGVIVGVASFASGRRAIRWTASAANYEVEILPLLTGEVASYATAINNLGEIVGARAGILGTPYGFGWIYTDAGGLVDLYATHGWFATPSDINDSGVILSETQIFDSSTGTVTDVGLVGPSNYNAIGGIAMNNTGQIVGSATLRSTSLNIVSVFRYVPGNGWEFISGTTRYTVANDINNLGDVSWGEQGAGIYLDGLGAYALGGLLAPEAVAAGWSITGSGCLLNDQGSVATVGRNSVTGQAGAILLTPAGVLSPPSAPANLQALPHPATRMEPYNAINLTWENTSPLTDRYELERQVAGAGTWISIPLVPPAFGTSHTDTSVGLGITYNYRVRAVGDAGPGAWSAIATATSPAIPMDTTAPVINILSPANGASVSGIVPISVQASDNVGVETLEIRFWNQFLGQEIILGSVSNAGILTAMWDTRSLNAASYTLRAFASDSMGNWKQAEISLNVSSPPRAMRVTNIALSKSFGTSSITGSVYVKDGKTAVSNASVAIRWTLPGGTTMDAVRKTDATGRALFSVSGARGTYTLTVTNVSKTGYIFDTAGSTLSKSIKK